MGLSLESKFLNYFSGIIFLTELLEGNFTLVKFNTEKGWTASLETSHIWSLCLDKATKKAWHVLLSALD